MKKLLLIAILSFTFATAFSIDYWQPYPISAVVTSNGSQTRVECSVYDSLLGSWQYYNSPYYSADSNITIATAGTTVGYYTILYDSSSGNNYPNGSMYMLIYDQELHLFVPLHLTVLGANPGDIWQFNMYSDNAMIGYYSYDDNGSVNVLGETGYLIYDIASHAWMWVDSAFAPYDPFYGFPTANIASGGGLSINQHDEVGEADISWGYYDPSVHYSIWSFADYVYNYQESTQDLIHGHDNGSNDIYSWFTAFDPTTHSWNWVVDSNYSVSQTYNGIFYSAGNYFGLYDDSLHQWKIDTVSQVISKVKIKDRVVAYADTISVPNKIYYEAFSPTTRMWRKDSSTVTNGINSIYIQNGTVHWVDNSSNNYFAGYNDTIGWGNFNTPLLLNFHITDLSSISGDPLIFVRNYSLGTDTVMYDFGDGITTGYHQPSLYHLFKVNGHYMRTSSLTTQNYNVCISSGTQSSCESISYNICSVSGTASILNDTLCQGDTTVLSLAGYTGNIQWQEQSGINWINDNGATSDTLKIVPSFTTTYRAMVYDSICIPAFSNSIKITVFPTAVAGTAYLSTDSICPGAHSWLSVAGTVGNAIQWQSYNGTSWVNETGPGNTYSYYQVSPVTNTQYRAVVSSGSCTTDTSNQVSLTVLVPTVPLISQNMDTLTSTPAVTYQWYRNTILIPGGTLQNYTMTQNGTYKVVVTGSNGCSSTSAPFVMTSVGLNNINGDHSFTISPNPAKEEVTVNSSEFGENIELKIYDILGRVIYSSTLISPNTELNTASWNRGVYFVRVYGERKTFTGKVVVE